MYFTISFGGLDLVQKTPACKEFKVEGSGSVGRALDWGLKGCWFEPHHWWCHCVVSLSKTLYPLLSTGSTQEDQSRHD